MTEGMCTQVELSRKALEFEEGAIGGLPKWLKLLVSSWIWIFTSPTWLLTTPARRTKRSRDLAPLVVRLT